MDKFTAARDASTRDELWLVEHEPVFTLGRAGRAEHVLAAGDIPVIRCDRGGQVTYHGPGQIVAYPLFDLRRLGGGIRVFVRQLEQCMIDALAAFGITGKRRESAPGVYVHGAKIGALGLHVRHGCTTHGLALNVALDLEPFHRINPCGYKGLQVTQVIDWCPGVSVTEVQARLVESFSRCFDMQVLQFAEPPAGLAPVVSDAVA